MSANRQIPLEATRGIAAIIVVAHHFFLAFAPFVTGTMFSMRTPRSLSGSVGFVLVNGSAAVYFFFLLSGFVLTLRFHAEPRWSRLAAAVVKRLPRLWGPAAVSILLCWLLLKLGLDGHVAAAKLSHSEWLSTFAYADWSADFVSTLRGALADSITLFFTGQSHFNTNLWTMQPELNGSLIAFGLAAAFALLRPLGPQMAIGIFLCIVILPLWPLHVPFIAGAALSSLWVRTNFRIGSPLALAMIVVGIYLLGYYIPERDYAWAAVLPDPSGTPAHVVINGLGVALIIAALVGNSRIASPLAGRIGRWLGRMSFPLYLVHTVVILTIGSVLFAELGGPKPGTLAFAEVAAAVAVLSVVLALPLMVFDEWWTRGLNTVVNALLSRRWRRAGSTEPH